LRGGRLQRVSFTTEKVRIPDNDLNSLLLNTDTHFLEIIQGAVISKSHRSNGLGNLGDTCAVSGDGFHFAVKIDFEG